MIEFGPLWNKREKSEVIKRQRMASPSQEAELSEVFIVNTDGRPFPEATFGTLPMIKPFQGKYSPEQFKELAGHFNTLAVELSGQDKKDISDRLKKRMGDDADMIVEGMDVLEKKITDNTVAIHSIVTMKTDGQISTDFVAIKHFYQNNCLGFVTVSLPAGLLGYDESLQVMNSVTLQ